MLVKRNRNGYWVNMLKKLRHCYDQVRIHWEQVLEEIRHCYDPTMPPLFAGKRAQEEANPT